MTWVRLKVLERFDLGIVGERKRECVCVRETVSGNISSSFRIDE